MFFVETDFKKCNIEYNDIFNEIDKKIYQYSTLLYNNKVYGFNSKINHESFDDLLNYRSILKMKLDCDKCLCNYSIKQIISKIRKITNSIC